MELAQHGRMLAASPDIGCSLSVRAGRPEVELVSNPREEAERPPSTRGERGSARQHRILDPTGRLDPLPSVGGQDAGFVPTTSRTTTCPAPSTNVDRTPRRGVTTRHGTPGLTIGPRAENEYAVEPVGVATITPSAENVVMLLAHVHREPNESVARPLRP